MIKVDRQVASQVSFLLRFQQRKFLVSYHRRLWDRLSLLTEYETFFVYLAKQVQ